MKTLLRSLLLSLALVATAGAQTDLAGKWQGKLDVAPGKSLVIQFVFTAKTGGGYTAVVTSPDDGAIKNVPAKTVEFADGKLKIDVPALSGGYSGALRNGAFEGEWSQEGSKLPLALRPFQAPTLTKADIDTLRGEWVGKLTGPGGTVTIVLRFSAGAGGAVQSTFDVPEQGVKDWEARNPELDDGSFALELPKAQAKIAGTLKGDQIDARWNQFGMSYPLTFKKGKYVPVVSYLDLTAPAFEQLKGRWHGTLNGLAVVLRFETDAQGRKIGYFDSTQQNLLNLPVSKAALAGTKVTVELGFGGRFAGELSGGKLSGEWNQPGLPKPLPLVLTRETKP